MVGAVVGNGNARTLGQFPNLIPGHIAVSANGFGVYKNGIGVGLFGQKWRRGMVDGVIGVVEGNGDAITLPIGTGQCCFCAFVQIHNLELQIRDHIQLAFEKRHRRAGGGRR